MVDRGAELESAVDAIDGILIPVAAALAEDGLALSDQELDVGTGDETELISNLDGHGHLTLRGNATPHR
jgi:hypothetical protein